MRWRHFAGLSHHLALPGRVRHQCAHTHTHTHTGGQGRKQAKISNYRKCHTHTHTQFGGSGNLSECGKLF